MAVSKYLGRELIATACVASLAMTEENWKMLHFGGTGNPPLRVANAYNAWYNTAKQEIATGGKAALAMTKSRPGKTGPLLFRYTPNRRRANRK